MTATRREFLKTTLGASTVVSFGTLPPSLLLNASARESASKQENILVVVQLSGGNDGVNTVIPYRNSIYRKNRPTLAVAEQDILRIDGSLGFHPSARGLADLLENDQLCIAQGVGYPNPNRSHFESMDIWHTCRRKTDRREDGWLGRFLENRSSALRNDTFALHLGPEKQPLALTARDVRVPSVRSLDEFRLREQKSEQLKSTIKELSASPSNSSDDLLGFVQSSTGTAIAAAERIESIGPDYRSSVTWPESGLGRKLKTVARLIASDLGTRIYYVTLDGFDTHSQQAGAHASLLKEFSAATAAFINDISAQGHGDRVTLFAFSEFGRRLKENASGGTDHGAAAPVFLAGNRVKPGLVGDFPSLTDLHDGDVKHHTDFRQIYATILENWLDTKSEPILGDSYKPVSVFS